MPRRQISILIFISILLLQCNFSLCGNEVLQEIPNTSKTLKAIKFSRDCGATTGFSTQVSILPYGSRLKDEPGNTFIINGQNTCETKWITNSEIEIHYNKYEQIFKNDSIVNGVKISFIALDK